MSIVARFLSLRPRLNRNVILVGCAVLVLAGAAGFEYYRSHQNRPAVLSAQTAQTAQTVLAEANAPIAEERQNTIYTEFLLEIFDKVKENYWKKVTDEELITLFRLSAEKVTGKTLALPSVDKSGLAQMFEEAVAREAEEKKKDTTSQIATVALANLEPFGRSGLYTQKDETNLKNMVQNIDTSTDLYQTLGVDKSATQEDIEQQYASKSQDLTATVNDKTKTEEERKVAEEKLALITRAHDTLQKEETRETYNQSGAEATVVGALVRPEVLHLKIKRFSPVTVDEFVKVANAFDTGDALHSLILDLRGNIGGAIDLLQYLLGPFLGQNQYAFEFFHQDEYTPYKTVAGWLPSLVRYKKVVVLIDGNAQSSTEMMAAALKKYNVGVLVGTKTKGWGTVEKVFALDHQIDPTQKYSMFLVHSLTLRDDNLPIEGRGVDPAVNINDKDWETQLNEYFSYPPLIDAVKKVLKQPL
ncbi:MAG: S41 family peptidase [Patescibacteria group bacterium]